MILAGVVLVVIGVGGMFALDEAIKLGGFRGSQFHVVLGAGLGCVIGIGFYFLYVGMGLT